MNNAEHARKVRDWIMTIVMDRACDGGPPAAALAPARPVEVADMHVTRTARGRRRCVNTIEEGLVVLNLVAPPPADHQGGPKRQDGVG